MRILIPATPVQVCQQQMKACLITNDGTKPVYLGTSSSVSISDASLVLSPRQSVNWGGGNLWALCGPGNQTELMILLGGDTSVSPVTDVTISAPVLIEGTVPVEGNVNVTGSVDISGGTINVEEISGNVNVDGSTVNIGNNVRIWGGGDYLGYTDLSILNNGEYVNNLNTLYPAIINGKYAAVRVMYEIRSIPAPTYIYAVASVRSRGASFNEKFANASSPLVAQGSMISGWDYVLGMFGYCELVAPVLSVSNLETVLNVVRIQPNAVAVIVRMHVWASYESNPKPCRTLTNYLAFPTSINAHQYVNATYNEPTQLRIIAAPGAVQAGQIFHLTTSSEAGYRTGIGQIAANLTNPLVYNLYPSPGSVDTIQFFFHASNTGNIRILASPLFP